MKDFKTYLMENEKTYAFRIKMANMPEGEVVDKLESALEKYEVKSFSKPKKTPIQEHPMDFQTLNNADVAIMDVELSYPTTAHQLREYILDQGLCPASHIVVINQNHPEEIAREEATKEEEYKTKLEDTDYSDASDVKANELFGDEYNTNMLKSLETRKYEFAKKE